MQQSKGVTHDDIIASRAYARDTQSSGRYSRAQPEMRFPANENFLGAAVTALEAAGHNVVWVRIAAPGTTDLDVLACAARNDQPPTEANQYQTPCTATDLTPIQPDGSLARICSTDV